jgi:hypothetical protein
MKNPFKNPAPLAPTSDKVKSIALDDVSKSPERGTLVKKKNTQSGNPVIENHKVRPHVKATSGARYGVKVKFQKSEAPEAGATQANGRLLPSAIKRSAPNFSAGMTDHK